MARPYQWVATQWPVSLALGLGTLPAYQLAASSTNQKISLCVSKIYDSVCIAYFYFGLKQSREKCWGCLFNKHHENS